MKQITIIIALLLTFASAFAEKAYYLAECPLGYSYDYLSSGLCVKQETLKWYSYTESDYKCPEGLSILDLTQDVCYAPRKAIINNRVDIDKASELLSIVKDQKHSIYSDDVINAKITAKPLEPILVKSDAVKCEYNMTAVDVQKLTCNHNLNNVIYDLKSGKFGYDGRLVVYYGYQFFNK